MPNRYTRESAIESESVNSLSWLGEVFWRRLINRVDDFGRFTANVNLLRASIFPLQLDRVSVVDIERLLSECEGAGLCFCYQAQGKRLLVMNKWEKGRAKYSEYPDPPPDVLTRMHTYVYKRKHMLADVPDSDSDSDPGTDSVSDRHAGGLEVELPKGFPKTAEDAINGVYSAECGPSFVTDAWNKAVSRGGCDARGQPIRSFAHYIAIEWKYERERKEKEKNGNHRPYRRQSANRNEGTANEGRSGDYSNAAKKG